MENEKIAKTTIRTTKEKLKIIKLYCVDNDIHLSDFAIDSMLYFVNKDSLPKK